MGMAEPGRHTVAAVAEIGEADVLFQLSSKLESEAC
jgi:hypothetical protein